MDLVDHSAERYAAAHTTPHPPELFVPPLCEVQLSMGKGTAALDDKGIY